MKMPTPKQEAIKHIKKEKDWIVFHKKGGWETSFHSYVMVEEAIDIAISSTKKQQAKQVKLYEMMYMNCKEQYGRLRKQQAKQVEELRKKLKYREKRYGCNYREALKLINQIFNKKGEN